MGQCGLLLYTFAFAFWLLPFCVYSDGFASEYGSELASKRCRCDSVEFWLQKRTNRAPKLLSYEAIASNSRSDDGLLSKSGYRVMRLWLPKQCDMLPENTLIRRKNAEDRSIEIQFKDDSSASCLTVTLKCKLKTLCIGIDIKNKDGGQSTQRKLLMFKTDDSEETIAQQPYRVIISVLVFCSMVVLIALCGKAEKKYVLRIEELHGSQQSVAHDSSVVKIVSSDKIKSIPRQPANEEKQDHEEKAEVIEIKVEGSSNSRTDSNSNWSEIDLSSVAVTGGGLERDGAETTVDGAVLGRQKREDGVGETRNGQETIDKERKEMEGKKGDSLKKMEGDSENRAQEKQKRKEDKEHERQKQKEDKRKEKEVKNKDRTKDMRSRRSHTVPSEGSEPKSGIVPKMRLSLKGGPSNETTKKEKKKSKKKSADNTSPSANSPGFFAGDRRSFTNRELPKRPPGDDTKRAPEEHDDSDEDMDDNYESVVVQKVPPGNSKNLHVPSSNPPSDRGSQNYDPNASLYDSVDDISQAKPQGSTGQDATADDTYETVVTKGSKAKPATSSTLEAPELYESVGGEYDQPNITRQRSFSEITPSTPRTDAQRKVMSLGREKKPEVKPTPPPLDHLRHIAHMAIDDIEPYTVTIKKGDRIVQEETSISEMKQLSENSPDESRQPLSPEELAKLYARVDKNKQIKDRMEVEGGEQETHSVKLYASVDKDKQIKDRMDAQMENRTIDDEETTQTNGDGAHSVSVVAGVAEHQYETLPRNKTERDSFHETEDFQLYEEVDTKDNAKPKQEIAYV